ncbi:uncharacterized protein BN697_00274 [Bacteroides sp. CAG:530]|nr:uncharacterized protein BN697_00274 [Bacteroides sp. CAG:530]
MKNLTYYLSFALWFIISLLPLWVFYRLSDGLYYLVYHVVRYRRRVVYANLRSSFPEKSEAEIERIAKDFYSFFCDYIVETLKLFSMGEKNIRKRMKFEGLGQVKEDFANGRSVSVYLGHYYNWEWISSLGLHLDEQCGQIYHPLENATLDRLFLYMRGRFKAQSIKMDDTFLTILKWKKEGRKNIVGYIADQVPGYNNIHYWADFLHHDTPVFTGAERISKIMDTAVYYIDVERPRRGYYVARFIKIADSLNEHPVFFATEQYFRLLEKNIQRAPQYWLWSHKRWKRTREEFNRMFTEEERKKRLSKP